MKEQIEKRIGELKAELNKANQIITNARNTVQQTEVQALRISGGIQALEELIKPEEKE